MEVLRNFIGDSYVYELEENIKYKAVEIRRNYALKLPDAVIAATALENDLTLITQNIKDFGKTKKLSLINLFDL